MGFWSNLAKIGGIAGSGIATAMTGGAAAPTFLAALKTAAPSIIGGVASGLAGGAQKGREAENAAAQDAASFAQRENAMKEQSLMGRAGLDLQQRGFGQQSQTDAYKKALQSALAMNLQDAQIAMPSRIPKFTISGGLRPSAIGAEGKAAAGELQKQAMLKLMNGEQFDKLPAYQGTAAAQYKKPGIWENLLGGVGLAGNTINTSMGAAEDRDTMQKYIDAIKAITAQGQGGQAGPPPTNVIGQGALPEKPKQPLEANY